MDRRTIEYSLAQMNLQASGTIVSQPKSIYEMTESLPFFTERNKGLGYTGSSRRTDANIILC